MKLPSRIFLRILISLIFFSISFLYGITAQARPQVKFSTNYGDFVVELYEDQAPMTVSHFLKNVNDKVYDNTIFHKKINDFILQGGGFDPNFSEKPIQNRLTHEGQDSVSKGDLRNTTGTLAMARGVEKNSAANEFFINIANNPDLDPVAIPKGDPVPRFEFSGRVYFNVPRDQLLKASELFGYTTFGRIVSGYGTIEAIKKVPTGKVGPFSSDVPLSMVIIKQVELLRVLPSTPVSAPVLNSTSATVGVANSASGRAKSPSLEEQEVSQALIRWSTAWSTKDVPAYLASYASNYKAKGTKSRRDWEAKRKANIVGKSKISIKLDRIDITVKGETAVANFNQSYLADTVSSVGPKSITFSKIGGKWLIIQEEAQ